MAVCVVGVQIGVHFTTNNIYCIHCDQGIPKQLLANMKILYIDLYTAVDVSMKYFIYLLGKCTLSFDDEDMMLMTLLS